MSKKTTEDVHWDLSNYFANEEAFEQELTNLESDYNNFISCKGCLLNSPDSLLKCLDEYFSLKSRREVLDVYTFVKRDEDLSNEKNKDMRNRLVTFWYKMEQELSFVTKEINDASTDKIKEYLDKKPDLKKYEYFFKKNYQTKNHEPSENQKSIVSDIQIMNKNIESSAAILRNVEVDHGMIDGKKVNRHIYNEYMKSQDAKVRKEVYTQYWSGYKNVKNTFASFYISHLQSSSLLKKINKYQSSLEMQCAPNEVPISVYDNLINTVNQYLGVIHDYNRTLKQIYNLEVMHSYDLMLPVIKETAKRYTYEDAKTMILDALNPIGEKYITDLKTLMDKSIFYLKPNKNKAAGFYSISAYQHLPLILASYNGTIRSISSLAHEFGHAMCSYYSSDNLYPYNECDKFVLEVPSLVNQIIFYDSALKKAHTKEEKLEILYHLLGLYNDNLFYATKCAEFEKYAHETVEKDGSISPKMLYDNYLELTKKYEGEALKVSEEVQYEWLNSWQFYSDYYLYQYATGIIAATYIANNIIQGNSVDYIDFLKIGSSKKPTESLKTAGVDLTNPKTIENAIKVFNGYLEQFKEIYRS